MAKLGQHAVVLGASMGGLLAARVLADFYGSVTVVERDVLPDDPANRRGVPQGRHGHALLGRGSQILAELFPGLLDEVVAAGAPVLDYTDLSKGFFSFAGHQFMSSGAFRETHPCSSRADRCWRVLFGDGCERRRISRSWRATTLLI
jgi:2-polyprenyl-6-methoxyphenol hydroxylase-like FAD-dependent oxidoreductase